MKRKFDSLYENYASKFTRGGFLPGDFVKFKSDIMSHPSIQAGSQEYRDKIQELMDSDLNIRLQGLTSTAATKSAGSLGTADKYDATVYQTLPGNSATSTENLITVPLSTLELVAPSSAEAQIPVPKSFSESCEDIKKNYKAIDFFDDSYDKGKSVVNKKLPESDDEEFDEDSDEFPSNRKLKESSDFEESDNLKFYVVDMRTDSVVEERNISNREKLNIDRLFGRWAKDEGYRVSGKDATLSSGDFYARIADTLDGIRVLDSCNYFVDVRE